MATTKIRLVMIKPEGCDSLMYGDNLKLFEDFERQLPEGEYTVEIRKLVKDKTTKQLGAHFGLMIQSAIAQANDMGMDTSTFLKEMVKSDLPSGIGLTTDFLKEILYCLCPIYHAGKRITLSKASTIEASQHFEQCCKLLAGHGIYIDNPDPQWRTKTE